MEIDLSSCLAALSHPRRLALFQLLVRRYPDALPAGEIAGVLELKGSTASVYLAALRQAGLIAQTRVGTSLLYRAEMDAARDVLRDLIGAALHHRSDLLPDPSEIREGPVNVLFVCTGNSTRSLMAESLMRAAALPGVQAYSAGMRPAAAPRAAAMDLLRREGLETEGLAPKPVSRFTGADAPVPDLVLTVCDHSANLTPPPWRAQPVCGHWGVDPAPRDGGAEACRPAFEQLSARIAALGELAPQDWARGRLQSHIDRIACLG